MFVLVGGQSHGFANLGIAGGWPDEAWLMFAPFGGVPRSDAYNGGVSHPEESSTKILVLHNGSM